MTTRLWPAGMVLALLLCAGQAYADKTCQFSNITINSTGTISITCGGSGLSVTLKNAAADATGCSYKDATPPAGTSAIKIDSSGVTAYCPGSSTSSGASFTLSAANSATVGNPLTFTVTRTKGTGSLGDDTLTLALASDSTTAPSFNPVSLSFGANEPDGTNRTPRVVFTKTGTATLTVTGTNNSVTPSGPITVSGVSAGAGTCAGIPVPPYASSVDTALFANSSLGTHRLIAASASERAAGAIRFTAPASGSLTFKLNAPGAGYPELSSLDMTVSACPGDFLPTGNACKVPGTNSSGVKISVGTTADCPVQANQPYYVNVRSVTPGRDVGLALSVQ